MPALLLTIAFLIHYSEAVYPTGCKQKGYQCVFDGVHVNKYYECNEEFEGIRTCPKGTRCSRKGLNKDTNPCEPIERRERKKNNENDYHLKTSSEKNGDMSIKSTVLKKETGLCKANGIFCVIDGVHDYQYLQCSDSFEGFMDCAPGTRCKGEQDEPYEYNPCIATSDYDPRTPTESSESIDESDESSNIPAESSNTPTESSGDNDESSNIPAESSNTPAESSNIPAESSNTSNESETGLCKANGIFCVIDGVHDYQYLQCSDSFEGFMDCAPGTRCKGEQDEPYEYNPCIATSDYDPRTPTESSESVDESSEKPAESSNIPAESSNTPTESSNIPAESSEKPVESSNTPSESETGLCKTNGIFCVIDGVHDYQYLQCSDSFEGFMDCAPGTRCKGEQDEPYEYNPCIATSDYDPRTPTESSESIDESSEKPAESSNIPAESSNTPTESKCEEFECKEDGLFCVIDDECKNKYYECASTFKGIRPCAPGTWCQGEQDKPYEYNPCVWIDQTTWFGNETRTVK